MFKKYNSIENAYREAFLESIKKQGFGDLTYVVQEKVHGANLSFWTRDGEKFRAAKRTEPIAESEKFYNYQHILHRLQPKLANIWNNLLEKYPHTSQVTFFGEIIGGDYPHEAVPVDKQGIMVQKGIYYSPGNHFFAFDIMLNGEQYLDVAEANTYFEKEGLLHAQTLFEGSLADCLQHPNNFNSTVPAIIGLPELQPNICEGVVIRPAKSSHLNNSSRVILKNKNEQWAENKKYHKTIRQGEELPEKIIKLQEAILTYVTENRLNNVISKIGEVTTKDFGKVLGMFNKDVIDDFLKDYQYITDHLEKKEFKLVTKSFNKTANHLVKEKMAALTQRII